MSTPNIEILVSTMHRADLDFLDQMFKNVKHSEELSVLVINQTSEDRQLISDRKNVRVINSTEIGLSKSRNLALQHAKGDICLLADDDIIYKEDLIEHISIAYNDAPNADFIIFRIEDEMGNLFKSYGKLTYKVNGIQQFLDVRSIEISFRRSFAIEKGLSFDEHFGLNAMYPMGEEVLFVHSAREKEANIRFSTNVIVTHPGKSQTTGLMPKDKVATKVLIFFKVVPRFYKLYLAKYLLYLSRQGEISSSEISHYYRYGKKVIAEFKH